MCDFLHFSVTRLIMIGILLITIGTGTQKITLVCLLQIFKPMGNCTSASPPNTYESPWQTRLVGCGYEREAVEQTGSDTDESVLEQCTCYGKTHILLNTAVAAATTDRYHMRQKEHASDVTVSSVFAFTQCCSSPIAQHFLQKVPNVANLRSKITEAGAC